MEVAGSFGLDLRGYNLARLRAREVTGGWGALLAGLGGTGHVASLQPAVFSCV